MKKPKLQPNDPDFWSKMAKIGSKAIRAKQNGRPKLIPTPQKFWDYACAYFEDTDRHNLIQYDVVRGGDAAGAELRIQKQRPYSWMGFTSYLIREGIIADLDEYRFNYKGGHGMFSDVVRVIDDIMFSQKFEGASAGIFNPSIIVRDLQLRDNVDLTSQNEHLGSKSPEKMVVEFVDFSDEAKDETESDED